MAVHQVLVSASRGDAVTGFALELRELLKPMGPSEIFARHIDAGLTTSVQRLARYQDQLRYLFIVSFVILEKGAPRNGSSGVSVQVTKAPGQKCERCWNYSTHVGEDTNYPTVCERCSEVLKQLEGNAAAR